MTGLRANHENAFEHDLASEHRDTERAIHLWRQKLSNGLPPEATAFDLHRVQVDWGYRFVISTDVFLQSAVFIIYGIQFGRIFNLPQEPNSFVPILDQLPRRYHELFIDGCGEVLSNPEPARFSGALRHGSQLELYRAAFMPLRAGSPLILGTFNRRVVDRPEIINNTYRPSKPREFLQHAAAFEIASVNRRPD